MVAPLPSDPHAPPDRIASLVGLYAGTVIGVLYEAILGQNVRGPLGTWQSTKSGSRSDDAGATEFVAR